MTAPERAVDAMARELSALGDREPMRSFKDDEWRPWTRTFTQLSLTNELSPNYGGAHPMLNSLTIALAALQAEIERTGCTGYTTVAAGQPTIHHDGGTCPVHER